MTFLCVVIRVHVNIIHFAAFYMERQKFLPSSIFELLVTACTKKNNCSDLRVKCPIFLSDFTLIWSAWAEISKSINHKISSKVVQWEPNR